MPWRGAPLLVAAGERRPPQAWAGFLLRILWVGEEEEEDKRKTITMSSVL
jgi:hypothetical protein